MLVLWQTQGAVQYQFNMYNTNHDQDGYCLLHYIFIYSVKDLRPSPTTRWAHQIIPYCLRSSEESISIERLNISTKIGSTITFAKLRERNISSEMLISWSAPIDQAERYQIFLSNVSNTSSEANTLFYNCKFPWFGPFCRFAFDITYVYPLKQIVHDNFFSKGIMPSGVKVTCYKHLQCDTLVICLDWREICDGKIDCLDGSDEFDCWQLEMNECTENEYRCYNGQCIPDQFFRDYHLDPDCLDGTDEVNRDIVRYPRFCDNYSGFRCEESKCYPGENEFSCGDGICTYEMNACYNWRSFILHNDSCSNAMACRFYISNSFRFGWCLEYCDKSPCATNHCPPLYEFPSRPVLFGHVRFIFSREEVDLHGTKFHGTVPLPKYVCYNEELCVDFLPAKVHLNGSTCRYFHQLGLEDRYHSLRELMAAVKKRFRPCLMASNEIRYLNQTMIYKCQKSNKHISKYHFFDGMVDCPFDDDETFNNVSCSLNDVNYRFDCLINGSRVCYAAFSYSSDPTSVSVEWYGCKILFNADTDIQIRNDQISFQTICDGYADLVPILVKGKNETDETGCEHWFCNNTYTRCNGLWSCPDGADEVNCPPSTCPEFHHSCVFLNDTLHVSCLPMNRAGDGVVDCLGATDEIFRCQSVNHNAFSLPFGCSDDTECLSGHEICDGKRECQFGDDELFCSNTDGWTFLSCYDRDPLKTKLNLFFCESFTGNRHDRPKSDLFFKLHNIPTYPSQLNLSSNSSTLTTEKRVLASENNLMVNDIDPDGWRCNRGLRIYIRTSNDAYNLSCLCPPSYYGDKCQYQSQRVSLTIQVQATSDWTTVFTFLIFLIDSETNIESHDHIEYLPSRDCNIKFNVYLLYSSRPKNLSKNYFIRIDAFNRMEMTYRASWMFPLRFPFLPVHRLPVRLMIPMVNVQPMSRCPFPCIHGQYFSFVNVQTSSFCRCFPGWSGHQCTRKYVCDCEVSSQCIDDSICLCPVGRFGPRCYLFQSACHSESCINGGQCIHDDERYIYAHENKSTCICPPDYIGDRCEYPRNIQTQIDISFDDSLTIPSSLVVHLVQFQYNTQPNQTSMVKKIGFDQSSLTFYTSSIFRLAFAEISKKNYYLIILQEQDILLSHISTKLIPSHRCASINELFNETIIQQELLQRIKLYHIPCYKQRELVCFYDSIHFCLCDHNRRANCFRFNHDMTYDCGGYNLCENGGQCFLDNRTCPTLTICACSRCSFGSKCQFSTEGSTLLLDIILGYRIRPNTGITEQSDIVKVAIALTIIIFVLGLISNFLTFLTFQMKNTRDVGCGIYLFASSIIGIILTCVLTVKFWLLLTSHMGLIKSRLFIQVQCISIDFLLRIILVSGDWLRACTSIERTMNVSRGVYFDKLKSKQIAKWTLPLVFLFVSCTHFHDPIHRHLVDDKEEQRTWCVTQYSSVLRIFDMIVNIIHFVIPVLINFISAVLIIITAARTRSNAQKKLSYRHHLREQFQQHKHLLVSSVVLVVLAIPRLYIAFLSGCMKSSRESWLYLIGYYISFIPSMLTFVIFVLPSKMYTAEFKKSIKRFL